MCVSSHVCEGLTIWHTLYLSHGQPLELRQLLSPEAVLQTLTKKVVLRERERERKRGDRGRVRGDRGRESEGVI